MTSVIDCQYLVWFFLHIIESKWPGLKEIFMSYEVDKCQDDKNWSNIYNIRGSKIEININESFSPNPILLWQKIFLEKSSDFWHSKMIWKI